jgi:hypothetical protein
LYRDSACVARCARCCRVGVAVIAVITVIVVASSFQPSRSWCGAPAVAAHGRRTSSRTRPEGERETRGTRNETMHEDTAVTATATATNKQCAARTPRGRRRRLRPRENRQQARGTTAARESTAGARGDGCAQINSRRVRGDGVAKRCAALSPGLARSERGATPPTTFAMTRSTHHPRPTTAHTPTVQRRTPRETTPCRSIASHHITSHHIILHHIISQ